MTQLYVPPTRLSTYGTRHRASTSIVLANILRSLFVARTPPVEARSADCRSNVENAPLGGRSPAGGARRLRPAGRSHYVVILRDGRKLVTRVRVMLP